MAKPIAKRKETRTRPMCSTPWLTSEEWWHNRRTGWRGGTMDSGDEYADFAIGPLLFEATQRDRNWYVVASASDVGPWYEMARVFRTREAAQRAALRLAERVIAGLIKSAEKALRATK